MADAGTVLGKEKSWAEMSDAERTAATVIGYDGASWDEGEVPPICELPWGELGPREQRAARTLGYTPEEWEAERLEDDD